MISCLVKGRASFTVEADPSRYTGLAIKASLIKPTAHPEKTIDGGEKNYPYLSACYSESDSHFKPLMKTDETSKQTHLTASTQSRLIFSQPNKLHWKQLHSSCICDTVKMNLQ